MKLNESTIDRVLSSSLGKGGLRIIERLKESGHEAWWVGGAVRDMARNVMPLDIDIATSALPEQVEALFVQSDGSARAFGAVTVAAEGHIYEVTTFRRDLGIADGRRPETVSFGSCEEDALRRDATMNAIYWDPISGSIFDPTGGLHDLAELLVRFIGNPETRVHEDALRILRLVRLRATINGQIEPETYRALRDGAGRTEQLSGERILEELDKILACPHPEIALEDLWELGVLRVVLPELDACKGVAQPHKYHQEGDVWNHLLRCTTTFTEDHGADVRLATLFHDIGKVTTYKHADDRIRFDHHAEASADIATIILNRLRAPRDREQKIHWIIRHHMMLDRFQSMDASRKAHWYFHPWFKELLQVCELDAAGTVPGDFRLYDWIVNDYNEFLNSHPRPEKPLLSGEEIMEILGIQPGARVGEVRALLHAEQIEKRITKKSEARDFVVGLQTKTSQEA